jgi:hypothetical protein
MIASKLADVIMASSRGPMSEGTGGEEPENSPAGVLLGEAESKVKEFLCVMPVVEWVPEEGSSLEPN